MKMRNRFILLVLLVSLLISIGCTGERLPNVGLDVNWKGFQGAIPFKSNDMGLEDSRSIEVIVENRDNQYVEGITLMISSNIPNIRISPDRVEVMPLGPKGTSRTQPAVFTIETVNTPPGKYSIWVSAVYGDYTIETERIDVDIG